jgi:predicted nucleotidyltransferase
VTKVLLKILSGSRGYGTHTDTSDYDIKGVYSPSRQDIFGLNSKIKVMEEKAGDGYLHEVSGKAVPSDLTLYDFRHFFQLLLESNPHLLDMVFSSPSFILEMDEVMEVLMSDPTIFLRKKREKHMLVMPFLRFVELKLIALGY